MPTLLTQNPNDPRFLTQYAGGDANIPVSSITPATPLNVQNPTTTDLSGSIVAGANAGVSSYNDYLKLLTPEKTDAQLKADQLNTDIAGLTASDTGRGAAQLTAEQNAGVTDLRKQVADVNSQILTKTAEYNKLATDVEGKPITMNSIIGEQAQIRKAQAADIGLLNALSLGLQGQLSAAQGAADRAVDLKYSDIEDQIKAKEAQLKLLEPTLTAEEKRRSDALQLYLNDQKTKIADQKANDKSFQTAKIQGLSNGMSADVAQQAQNLYNAGQTDQAYATMSAYTGTKANQVGGGGSSTGTFSNTQLNKGAINAEMPIADFKKLDSDSKNYFINNKKALTDATSLITDAASGALVGEEAQFNGDPQAIKDYINNQSVPQSVKDYLIKKVDASFPKGSTSSGPGFFSRIGTGIKNIWNAIF